MRRILTLLTLLAWGVQSIMWAQPAATLQIPLMDVGQGDGALLRLDV
jgi:hypothetical protein